MPPLWKHKLLQCFGAENLKNLTQSIFAVLEQVCITGSSLYLPQTIWYNYNKEDLAIPWSFDDYWMSKRIAYLESFVDTVTKTRFSRRDFVFAIRYKLGDNYYVKQWGIQISWTGNARQLRMFYPERREARIAAIEAALIQPTTANALRLFLPESCERLKYNNDSLLPEIRFIVEMVVNRLGNRWYARDIYVGYQEENGVITNTGVFIHLKRSDYAQRLNKIYEAVLVFQKKGLGRDVIQTVIEMIDVY